MKKENDMMKNLFSLGVIAMCMVSCSSAKVDRKPFGGAGGFA